jgi:hypothetical protein
MLLSNITLGQTYYTCCFIGAGKNVSSGVAKGKFEYEDGSCFVDLLLDEAAGFGVQIVRPNVTDIFATAAEAVTALETYLSSMLLENASLVSDLKTKYNIIEE